MGRTAKVKTEVEVDGARVHEGVIVRADGDAVVLALPQGERRIRLEDVASARTVFSWGPAERGRA